MDAKGTTARYRHASREAEKRPERHSATKPGKALLRRPTTVPRQRPAGRKALVSAPQPRRGPHERSAPLCSARRGQPRGFPANCPAVAPRASRPNALHRTADCPKLPRGQAAGRER